MQQCAIIKKKLDTDCIETSKFYVRWSHTAVARHLIIVGWYDLDEEEGKNSNYEIHRKRWAFMGYYKWKMDMMEKKFKGMRWKLSNFSVVGCSIPKNIFKTSFSSLSRLDGLMCPSSPRGSAHTHKKKKSSHFLLITE
mgnify:CR=1 FL=1